MSLSRCEQILESVMNRGHLEKKPLDTFTTQCIRETIYKIQFIQDRRSPNDQFHAEFKSIETGSEFELIENSLLLNKNDKTNIMHQDDNYNNNENSVSAFSDQDIEENAGKSYFEDEEQMKKLTLRLEKSKFKSQKVEVSPTKNDPRGYFTDKISAINRSKGEDGYSVNNNFINSMLRQQNSAGNSSKNILTINELQNSMERKSEFMKNSMNQSRQLQSSPQFMNIIERAMRNRIEEYQKKMKFTADVQKDQSGAGTFLEQYNKVINNTQSATHQMSHQSSTQLPLHHQSSKGTGTVVNHFLKRQNNKSIVPSSGQDTNTHSEVAKRYQFLEPTKSTFRHQREASWNGNPTATKIQQQQLLMDASPKRVYQFQKFSDNTLTSADDKQQQQFNHPPSSIQKVANQLQQVIEKSPKRKQQREFYQMMSKVERKKREEHLFKDMSQFNNFYSVNPKSLF